MADVVTGADEAAAARDRELTRARLAVALEAAQLGLWDWDLRTDALVWDARSVEMYGLRGVELTGRVGDIERAIHPEDLPRVNAALGGAIEAVGSVDVEFRVVWPDGSHRWVYARGQALVDATGAAVRVIGTNADVTEARRASHERAEDAARMAGLVAVAQALGDARTEAEVLEVVASQGVRLLGAAGAGLVLLEPGRDAVRTLVSGPYSEQLRSEVARLPEGFPLPGVHTATTGTEYFLADRAAATALFPDAEALYALGGAEASAAVPLHSGGVLVGALTLTFAAAHPWRTAERELVTTFAALAGQALERVRAGEAERAAAGAVARMSETLQRSLLTDPPQLEGLQVVARYAPAAHHAQVGGDWYDAFPTAEGTTSLVIGDVTGHDREAAAAMGQLRNLLRGIAYAVGQPPAAVLGALDRAVRDLQVPAMATAVLAHVGPLPDGGAGRLLRWSNAGHPPPLLVHPAGADGVPARVEVLETDTDLLLGVDPATGRSDHTRALAPGCRVLLYTDGLVERRGTSLDRGLEWLADAVARLAHLPLEQMCDALLAQLPGRVEDDVALLAVAVLPA